MGSNIPGPEDPAETEAWEASKRSTREGSNNPPLPPPNMDDFEATMIREENPLAEPPPDMSDFKMTTIREGAPVKVKPRRAKPNNLIWTYIGLGAWFFIAGFIGAFLGTFLANIL